MAENTAISWAHDTFNPWEGCTRISAACDNCYAAERAHRFGNDHLWAGELRRTSPAYWRKPLRWNEEARASGQPRRVFCASLADVFDNQAPQAWRDDLWSLIEATPHLTWMLLTKRPTNIPKMLPHRWTELGCTSPSPAPRNVWLGVTAEDQLSLDKRAALAAAQAYKLNWLFFLSAEPLLGPLSPDKTEIPGFFPGSYDALTGMITQFPIYKAGFVPLGMELAPLGLVIAGGESGPRARPSHPNWFRALRNQCADAGVPFHFKQWGEWLGGHWFGDGETIDFRSADATVEARQEMARLSKRDGRTNDDSWWSRLHCWDQSLPDGKGRAAFRVGKARAGRQLDGMIHDEMPIGSAAHG